MKQLIAGVLVALGLAGAAAADPVLGTWKTQVDDGAYAHVTFSTCGVAICGVIARTFNAQGEYRSPNLGRRLVWDMLPKGAGSYKGGRIWQPSTDKIYRSKMSLDGDRLRVSGCVGPLCKKQVWSRVK